MRKLVTIRRIGSIDPIPGADLIECATVDGWELVVKKGEFKVGDSGVYFEIDSMLPEEERYSFLKKLTHTNNGIGYRIKTIRLRKQISQGLMLPLSLFPELSSTNVGLDVTEALNVWKYEMLYRSSAGRNAEALPGPMFPEFLIKTDQERIQNNINYFDTLEDHEFEVTKKLDGSSMTVWNYSKAPDTRPPETGFWTLIKRLFVKREPAPTFGVCSRNVNLREVEGNTFWNIATKLLLREVMAGHNIAIQGELISADIQGNHEKVKEPYFYIFDIFDIDKQEYMLPADRINWLWCYDNNDKLDHVPIVGRTKIFKENRTVADLQKYVEGESINPGTISEGMVFKSMTNNKISFKCVSNKYLLKCEK
jgi:RNA ligase (TIGR02306 family)